MLSSIQMFLADLQKLASKVSSARSFVTYAVDRLLFSLGKLENNSSDTDLRKLELKNGISVLYRRNRGDVWSIREVLLDECYELPDQENVNVYVDLGANIGLTSLWASAQYSPDFILALEPQEENFALASKNFKENQLEISLLQAAVGAEDGEACFSEHQESNMGRLAPEGSKKVTVLGMDTILGKLPEGAVIDVLKVDIEGGEDELFSGDLSWLGRVQTIVAEFHPHFVDCDAIAERIVAEGFRHLKAGEAGNQMECFIRE